MIPKVIHYCWFGGNPIPDNYKKYMESWKEFCPDYEIIEWNESNYDVTKNKYMYEAYKAKKWAFVSDYARLDIVYNQGGIYLDTDVELIRCLDDLLTNEAFMGFDVSFNLVGTGLCFGSVKGNKIIKMLRDDYDKLHFINADGSLNTTVNGVIQTDSLVSIGLKRNNKKMQKISGMTVYPVDYFAPKSNISKLKITSNTYSIHHAGVSWFSKEQHEIADLARKLIKILPHNFSLRLSTLFVYIKNHGIKFTLNKIVKKLKGNGFKHED